MTVTDTADRFRKHIERLIQLLREHEIRSVKALIKTVWSDTEFRAKWTRIWKDIADAEGGKVGLTVAGAILGATLGGVGIAWGGMAIGLPLVLLLGLGGFLAGAEIDAIRRLTHHRVLWLRVPKTLNARIRKSAELSGLSMRELILRVLNATFPDPNEIEGLDNLDEPEVAEDPDGPEGPKPNATDA